MKLSKAKARLHSLPEGSSSRPYNLPIHPSSFELMKRTSCLVIAVLSAIATTTQAEPITLDDFSVEVAPTTSSAYITDMDILGGETEAFIGGATATFESTGGVATVSNVTAPDPRNFQFVWDGVDGTSVLDYDGLGGVDLTDSGNNDRFRLLLPSVTGTFDITVFVFSGSSDSGSYLEIENVDSSGLFEFAFTDFLKFGPSSSPANFTDVGQVRLSFSLTTGEGFSIDYFETNTYIPPVIPDTTKPKISFLNKKTLRKEKRVHNVKGRATDASGVAKVEVKVPRSGWKKAKLKASGKWTFRARGLKKGNNRLKVRATDNAGNRSKVKKVVAKGT